VASVDTWLNPLWSRPAAHAARLGVWLRRPEPGQSTLVPQPDEIEAAAWMPIEEYAAIPFIHSKPVLKRTLDRCLACAHFSGKTNVYC